MELLQWSNRFSVGIKEIDSQHQRLFSLVNQLITAVSNKEDTLSLSWVLEDLISYIDYHFHSEESYLRAHPSYTHHCQEHHAFSLRVKEFEGSYKEGSASLGSELFSFLVNWLSNHVSSRDRSHFRDLGYLL